MGYKTYYWFMLVFPLLAVLFILGPNWALPLRKDEAGIHVGLPLYLAIIPYCIFIASFIGWTWKTANKSFMRSVWLSPLILIPFALVAWAVLNYESQEAFSRNSSFLDFLELLGMAVATLVLGYLYVLMVVAICKLLRFVRLMK